MIMYTFLDEYDLSGKTIVPFNTSGGNGSERQLSDLGQVYSSVRGSLSGERSDSTV